MKKREFWFVVGSQSLYGQEVLDTVDARAREMAAFLSQRLPYPLVYKVTAKGNSEIVSIIKEANYHDECAGIVTWCHTFSPSKMWINGLTLLQKPWCHLATQYNQEIPNEEIDMDFMNLNQAATATGSTALSVPACVCPGRSLPATGRMKRSAAVWASGCVWR